MKKIRTLIVDDEPLAREGIALMLEADNEVEVLGACADGRAALDQIQAKRPGLVFLDVQMPRLNGFEVLAALPGGERPVVIFVTAFDQYAMQAFDVCAVDYLLKPFRDERFHLALKRAKERIRRADVGEVQQSVVALLDHLRGMKGGSGSASAAGAGARTERIGFKIAGGRVFVDAGDIVWIEAQGDSVKLCADGQTHLVRESLQSVEKRLDPKKIARVHRSFLANLAHIRKVTSALYGDQILTMSDATKLPLSRSYRDKFKALLNRP